MDLSPVVIAIPIYFILIAIELAVQHFTEKKVYRLNDALTNIGCGILSQLSGLFLKILSVGVYHVVYTYASVFKIPSTWYTIAILFLLVDLAYYWAHRMSHEVNLFWGGHVVHHQSEDYNLTVALRQSSFQVIWTFAFYLPLAVLGFNTLDFVLMAGLTTVYQFWIHTPYIGKLPRPIETVLNTPSHHRVHHGRDPKYIDRNHAGVFIIWDKMFGTFQEEEETPTYGITKPVNSWNPFWVNFEHYAFMWHEMRRIKGVRNKLKYLFYKPGWLPDELGGYRRPPKVDPGAYKKFNTISSPSLNLYILTQFFIATGFTALFLFKQDLFSTVEKIAFSALIIWSISGLGVLFEGRGWARPLERLRLLIIFGISLGISFYNSWDLSFLIPGLAFFLTSYLWLSRTQQLQHETSG